MRLSEKEIKRHIVTSLNKRIFSGAAVGFSKREKGGKFKRFTTYCGHTASDIFSKDEVKKETLFDLASLTKPLVTTLCILHLLYKGTIQWNEKLNSLLSKDVGADKTEITLHQLLSHSAGLPAHRPYHKYLKTFDAHLVKEAMIQRILNEPTVYLPGSKNIYSDLGYILLGNIIEIKTGRALNEFWREIIAGPLDLQKDLLFLKNKDVGPEKCVATILDKHSSRPVYGIVNDDNCRIIGGVSGHAGLYGTLRGVLSICELLLNQCEERVSFQAYSNAYLIKALTRLPQTTWVCGFDTPSSENSVTGKYFSESSFGHLGYTGTSFWIDREKKVIVAVLTNRVYMKTTKEQMNNFRKNIHDRIMEGIADW